MRRFVSCLTALLLSGCTQVYYYVRQPNADQKGHEAVAYWSITERALWFDENGETVRLTLQCGRTLPFQERAGGLFVLFDPNIMAGPKTIDGEQYCGQVIGAKRLDQIATDRPLQVDLWCSASAPDDEGFTEERPSLPPGQYSFEPIQRSDRAPQTAPCPTNSPEREPARVPQDSS